MIQRASEAGELALRLLSQERSGAVTRVFPRSAYVEAGGDFVLLLWGKTRSPMTVNIAGKKDGSAGLRAGEECLLAPSGISSHDLSIRVRGAKAYRGSLLRRRTLALPTDEELAKGLAMSKALYGAAQGPTLPDDPSFRRFADETLTLYSESRKVPEFDDFLGLVGRGGGFTPAGDDFTSGFTATFNQIARVRGTGQIEIPRGLAFSRTIPESAAIMVYSSMGYVDEGLERLILDLTAKPRRGFYGDLLGLASRGHTSGVDMSLGALLAVATASDATRGGRALEKCLGALWPT